MARLRTYGPQANEGSLSGKLLKSFNTSFPEFSLDRSWQPNNCSNEVLEPANCRYQTSMTDLVTPGYQKLLKSGSTLPVNPMTRSKTQSHCAPSDISWTVKYKADTPDEKEKKFNINGHFLLSQSPLTLNSQPSGINAPVLDTAALLQKAQAKVQAGGWDAGTSLAEFHKTLSMFLGLKRRFVRLLATLLSKASKDPIKAVDEIADIWLELRYGWRPFLYEMESVSKTLQNLTNDDFGMRRYTAYDTDRFSGQKDIQVTYFNNDLGSQTISFTINGVTIKRRTTVISEARAMVGIAARVEAPPFIDPFVTAWELVPFSFVIDWFLNFDEFLAAWSPVLRSNVVAVSLSEKTTVVTYDTLDVSPIQGVNYTTHDLKVSDPGYFICQREFYTRSSPAVTMDLSTKIDLDFFKGGDIAALIWKNLFRR